MAASAKQWLQKRPSHSVGLCFRNNKACGHDGEMSNLPAVHPAASQIRNSRAKMAGGGNFLQMAAGRETQVVCLEQFSERWGCPACARIDSNEYYLRR
ncbi:unnamed protein product, partial [Iphiclides podalirius]